jgi:RNA methyltransferase, TrmH family
LPHPVRISSASSDRVKAVRALHSRSGRRKAGRFVVEGPQAVRSALLAGVVIHELVVADDAGAACADLVDEASSRGITVIEASPAALSAMGETEHPQGVLAVCDLLPAVDLDAVMAVDRSILVLDGVSDPGNVGTAIRSADACGAGGVILGPGCVDPHNGKVVRATVGSLFHLPVVPHATMDDIVAAARRHQRALVVLAGDGDEDLFAAVSARMVCRRTCWVVGSEAHGVGPEARAAADLTVRIPMIGRAESLNAGVAASVALYVTAYGTALRGVDTGVDPAGGFGAFPTEMTDLPS